LWFREHAGVNACAEGIVGGEAEADSGEGQAISEGARAGLTQYKNIIH